MSQMPNVICETNMKHEFNFWKNALLATLCGMLSMHDIRSCNNDQSRILELDAGDILTLSKSSIVS